MRLVCRQCQRRPRDSAPPTVCLLLLLPLAVLVPGPVPAGEPRPARVDRASESETRPKGGSAGIGAHVKDVDGAITITEVFPGNPAARAGLQAGTVLLAVDGVPLAGVKLQDAVRLLRGNPGTAVELEVRHASGTQEKLKLLRERIVQLKPEASLVAPTVGLIRLLGFNQDVPGAVRMAVFDLQQKGATRFILDLRGSPGGDLRDVGNVAALFLRQGQPLWMFEAPDGERKWTRAMATGGLSMPLAVLIDAQTVGGAELLAAAMKRNRRGPLIGHRTPGAISARSPVKDAEGRLRLVPNGIFLQSPEEPLTGVGVEPDQVLGATAAPEEFVRAALAALEAAVVPAGGPEAEP